MIDRVDITDEYSVKCNFILDTVIFIDAALNTVKREIFASSNFRGISRSVSIPKN